MRISARQVRLCLGLFAVLAPGLATATTIANGSFENNLQDWVVEDIPEPFVALQAGPAGLSPGFGLFTSAPTDGSLAALTGFDGAGPGLIRLSQDVSISQASDISLKFDYRAGWDLLTYCSGCTDRQFQIVVREAGGGAVLATYPQLTASAGNFTPDTGNLLGSVDLSSFAGQSVRVSFEWLIPDNFSGPAFFQLDHVRVEEATEAWIAFGASRRQLPPAGGVQLRWDNIIGIIRPGDEIGAGAGTVVGASRPWVTGGGWAELNLTVERLKFNVSALNLASGNEIGTPGQLTQVKGTLICDTNGSASASGDSVLVETPPIPVDSNGNAAFNGSVSPLPAVCRTESDVAFVLRNVISVARVTAARQAVGRGSATYGAGLTVLHHYPVLIGTPRRQPGVSPFHHN